MNPNEFPLRTKGRRLRALAAACWASRAESMDAWISGSTCRGPVGCLGRPGVERGSVTPKKEIHVGQIIEDG